ncbi:MAG: UDP-3-O-acyl-N-acetylglucosamine deacetylase [Chlamydiae bacterium]|nr:UDP-3-O-acyl-N-acetylglucosamine deacetylase [Chlamydiota bacterium]
MCTKTLAASKKRKKSVTLTHTQTKQKTLRNAIHFQGVGLFSGQETTLSLIPQKENTGIVFERLDLKKQIPLSLEYLDAATFNCTGLSKDGVKVHTIEHLLSALLAYNISNLLIQIDNQEIPIFDGSAKVFVDEIEKVGVCELDAIQEGIQIDTPIFFSKEDVTLIALPHPSFKVSYTFFYPKSKRFSSQFLSVDINPQTFKEEISFARTFAFYDDIAPFIEMGLVKGADFERGLLIKNDKVQNNSLHREDELVRHKILDLVGDLALLGKPLFGHIVAIRSGHKTNTVLARQLQQCEGVNV